MNPKYKFHHVLWQTADWVFPPICAGCGNGNFRFCPECISKVNLISRTQCLNCLRPIKTGSPFCSKCKDPSLLCSDLASWGIYEGVLREAIHSLKYKRDIGLGDYFAEHLIPLLGELHWSIDLVVPIPLSQLRYQYRGFNQAEVLAKPIAWYLDKEFSTKILSRKKETESQYKLSSTSRKLNLEDAFNVNPATLKDRKVLLVDDIITTGATMQFGAKALLNAGATQVYGVSIAKSVMGHGTEHLTNIAENELILTEEA